MTANTAAPTAKWVAGVDGCRAGWVVVLRDRARGVRLARVVPRFEDVLSLPEAPEIIAVDAPIGLLTTPSLGGRTCEMLARRFLGPRVSSIFSSPTRPALAAFQAGRDFVAVSLQNQGNDNTAPKLSRQTFGILPKISEVDRVMTPSIQKRVREVHPELCFTEANAGLAMAHSKKTSEGKLERTKVLATLGFKEPLRLFGPGLPRGLKSDDVLDACIACWTAERIAAGTALVIPDYPPTDSRGLRMELWR